jgi:hypothetical protein
MSLLWKLKPAKRQASLKSFAVMRPEIRMINTKQVEQVQSDYFKSLCEKVSTLSITDVYLLPSIRKNVREGIQPSSIGLGRGRVLITNIRPSEFVDYPN